MTDCPAIWDLITLFIMMQILVLRSQVASQGELRWLYPCGCNQVLETSACNTLRCSFCFTDYLLGPHVELLLIVCRLCSFMLFFPGISIFRVTCVRKHTAQAENIQDLPMPAMCWLSLRYIFLDFSGISSITIFIWLLFLCYSSGSYLLPFKGLPQKLSLLEHHCVPGSPDYPPP